MRVRRKLVRLELLRKLAHLHSTGVPIARLIRDYSLDISLPHLKKLISYQELTHAEVAAALNPPWLDCEGSDIQEAPMDWKYTGLFPFGAWLHEDD